MGQNGRGRLTKITDALRVGGRRRRARLNWGGLREERSGGIRVGEGWRIRARDGGSGDGWWRRQ